MPDATLAEQIGAFATASTFDVLPADVVASVRQRVLDTLGICVAASPLDTSRAARAFAAGQGGHQQAHAVGMAGRCPATLAAFVNGVLAHSLDYDDTHLPSVLHPSASVIPGALAAGEMVGASGAPVIAAIACGLEVCVRLGMAGYDESAGSSTFFDHGQHATSICGALGAAVAAGLLFGFDAAGVTDALGVAASMASGIIEANRTGGTVKRMHCGWAAHAGVSAAQLVRYGFTGPPTVLEGRFGFFEAWLHGRADLSAVTGGLGTRWAVPGIFFKPYPANHFTHTAIDAAAGLRRRGVDPWDIESMELGVAAPIVRTIGEPIEVKRQPETGYMAQFSGPYAVVAGLLGGSGLGVGLDDFTDALARDHQRRQLMDRVSVVEDAECTAAFPHQFPAVLRARLRNGDELVERVMTNWGGPDRPLSDRDLVIKFEDNAGRALEPASVAEVGSLVADLAALDDVGRLLAPLGAAATGDGLGGAPAERGRRRRDRARAATEGLAGPAREQEGEKMPTSDRPPSDLSPFDLVVRGVRVVRPGTDLGTVDIGVRDGRFEAIGPGLPVEGAATVVDGRDRLAFPGVVDAHQHWGIYNPLAEDARSESRACAQGGVTTGITYFRTGAYYMNRTGPYAEVLPAALDAIEGNAHVDYALHVAPILAEHIDEIPTLIEEFGVTSFKIFMFYGKHGLHGRSSSQDQFLMLPDGQSYDYAYFEFIMRAIQRARQDPRFSGMADDLSLSLHCETAEIMSAYTKLVEEEGRLKGLKAYHASRPPHSEGLAVTIAAYLAHETGLPTINLLHLSSRKAVEAAMLMAAAFPHVDFRREVTIGHLLVDIDTAQAGAKVNPPIRPRDDVEALWDHVLSGDIDWVVSDHACCRDEMKFGEPRDDVFVAKSGFGGTEYLLPGLITEGTRRGLSYNRIAELSAANPAGRFGLHTKGVIAEGYDADFCLVDPSADWVVHAADSASSQEYTPFEGFAMSARVTDTFLRGERVLRDGELVGPPRGRYVRRPSRRP